jgi:2-C-methyl-D-erythritol 4-phosphate cytidylyltransferase
MAIWVIVPAAGTGTRMSSSVPKQYLQIDDVSVLKRTLKALTLVPGVQTLMLALDQDDDLAKREGLSNGAQFEGCELLTCVGGDSRAQSVLKALHALAPRANEQDWVLVHDAARPCVRPEEVNALLLAVQGTNGGLLAAPVRGTLKRSDGSSTVAQTVDRENMWEAATPQAFPFGLLQQALENAFAKGLEVTDDASAMEAEGFSPLLVPCSPDNIKITYPQDLTLAALILQAREQDGIHVE